MQLHFPIDCEWFIALSLLIGSGASHCEAKSPKEVTNSVGMELVLIPKGTFTKGSPIEQEGADNVDRIEPAVKSQTNVI